MIESHGTFTYKPEDRPQRACRPKNDESRTSFPGTTRGGWLSVPAEDIEVRGMPLQGHQAIATQPRRTRLRSMYTTGKLPLPYGV